MPTFKGFEKNEQGQTCAVVDFPDARKTSFAVVNGAIAQIETANPHEERLPEDAFQAKFKVDFGALPATFPDEGFSLDTIATAADAKPTPSGPAPRAPDHGNTM